MTGKGRTVHIQFDDELAAAMEEQMEEFSYYLDLDECKLVYLTNEAINDYYEVEEDELKALGAKDKSELTDIEYDMLKYDDIISGNRDRYVAVESVEHWVAHEDMKAFIATIKDEKLKIRLYNAIQGRGAFGRFKGMISRVPNLEESWYKFQRLRQRDRISKWLGSKGISCTFDPL